MLKELLGKFSSKLKKPLLILGATGFSTTVVACYGPPSYKYNTELESGAVEVLTQCVDGTAAHVRCDYGCLNGNCLKEGAPCRETYPELCGQNDLNRDKKITCVDGKMQVVECNNCESLGGKMVKCGDSGQAEAPTDERPVEEPAKEES